MNAQRVKDYYWGAAAIDKDNVQKVVNAISDSSYSHPIDTASKIHAMKSQGGNSVEKNLLEVWLEKTAGYFISVL